MSEPSDADPVNAARRRTLACLGAWSGAAMIWGVTGGVPRALGMGTIDTVWLRFDEPFWSTDAVVWNLVGTDDDVTLWYNLEPLTGEPILVGIVGGEAALRTEELNDQEFIDSLLLTLVPFAS